MTSAASGLQRSLKNPFGIRKNFVRFPFPNFSIRDGGRSSMVEPQIVVLVVAGSSPVGHPSLFFGWESSCSAARHLGVYRLRNRRNAMSIPTPPTIIAHTVGSGTGLRLMSLGWPSELGAFAP